MNPLLDFFQRNQAQAKIELALFTKSHNLQLEDFDLITVPNLVLNCEELHQLFLARNKINMLPSLSGLKNLHTLALDYNNLDKFPKSLCELIQLKYLNLSHNPIEDLTEDIGYLVNLETLWCNACCLTYLPKQIGNLENLDTFGARNNQITDLSDGICKLEKLRWLTLENNKIKCVPKNFHKLQALIHINFNKNNFNYIPNKFTRLKKLKYLLFQNNELLHLEEYVLKKMKHVYKINLMYNPIVATPETLLKFSNIIFPGAEYDPPPEYDHDSDASSSSSEDWENSIGSSELDFETSGSEIDDDDIFMESLPKLSKYLVTY